MRRIEVEAVTEAVRRLCMSANRYLPADAERALRAAAQSETWQTAAGILDELCRNLDTARETGLPICQDTGLVTVFAELGEEVQVPGLRRLCRRASGAATGTDTSERASYLTRSAA